MKKDTKTILEIIIRYSIILISSISNLFIFYKILTPITISSLKLLISFKYPLIRSVENFIYYSNTSIEIIPACVAGAAYFLLFILCMSIPNLKPLKRLKLIISSFALFLIFNLLRMLILLKFSNSFYFESLHWLFWNVISTLFVVAIWFFIVKLYKIKEIPFYSDFVFLKKLKTKNSKSYKKNN